MKTKFTLALGLLSCSLTTLAQNQITTPTGQPLVIGNQGVKLSNLTSSSATQPTNGKVLTVDANGLIFLAPDASGAPSQFSNNGSSIFYNSGNVGLGTDSPLQRLDVNGDINIPGSNAIRFNNVPFLRSPGTENIFLGVNAGPLSPGGTGQNVHIGPYAGSVSNGANNIFIGKEAGMVNSTASGNSFIGWTAGKANTTGFYNTFIGPSAGQANVSSDYNTFIGPNAGYSNSAGEKNMFIGVSAGYDNTSGSSNLFLGYDAGRKNVNASNNAFVGTQAGKNTVSGSSNTFIGANAGATNSGGFSNTAIGADADFGSGSLSNATAIGSGAIVNQNNSIVLGNATSSVGIANSAPTARFHVTAGGSIASGVRFEGLPTSAGTTYPLYVDINGNVMRSSSAGARESAEGIDRNWMLTADGHLINNNTGGIMIGTGLTTTPTGYKLYVSDGILTERVKVAVKSTADWRDNVLQKGYPLRSVEEVESFIDQNGHLPGVPSAQEMVDNGNDLQKTDAILLEKVEELMLYVIDLTKQNNKLQDQTKEQQRAIQDLKDEMAKLKRK
jgi:hypothetical protein